MYYIYLFTYEYVVENTLTLMYSQGCKLTIENFEHRQVDIQLRIQEQAQLLRSNSVKVNRTNTSTGPLKISKIQAQVHSEHSNFVNDKVTEYITMNTSIDSLEVR